MRNSFHMSLPTARKCARLLLASVALFLAPMLAQAAPVQMKPGLLRLNGNLVLPAGENVSGNNVVILLHGSLSDYRQETIASLQKNLAARGVASLAINLSLGIDDRRAPRACDIVHDYALAGAKREVGLWVEWLKAQQVRRVDLLGFSRGGAQVAAMAPELPIVRRLVLMAPAFATAVEQADTYERAFGHPLKPELDEARKEPLQKHTVDFLACKQAPVLGATFLDGYAQLAPRLAAKTGHPTLVVVAGKDEIVPDLKDRLPSDVHRVIIDGSTHFFLDLYGEEAADAITRFLMAPAGSVDLP
jgi:pimeloyl-ACP methyl ester carboxylesterase